MVSVARIPAALTEFVGRRQATAEVKGALGSHRLVTLTGVGGTGKTRLALHVAGELRRVFADGVWLVDLAALRDPGLLEETVVAALGVSDTSTRDPVTVLVDHLADKRLVLVLDNCEHLLDSCARLVATLLRAAPRLRVLATSRAPLGVTGERVWPVAPLAVPPEGSPLREAIGSEAVVLFEQRAADSVPGFAVTEDNVAAVVRLCRQLDGLPLALELAAVQLRTLSVEQIVGRLQDRFLLLTHGDRAGPTRHQTLRAAVEWSFGLCTELERTMWARLSVFPAGFDLAAAEQVCAGEGVLAEYVLTALAGLVDKSLVIKREQGPLVRYRMLDTIRQYGSEQLGGEKEKTLRRRHRDHYLLLAEHAEADWFGSHQVQWLERFGAEQPNMRVALEFCLTEPCQARCGLRMAGALYWYWMVCALRDGRWWLERVLAADTQPSPERTTALWAAGFITFCQGDLARSRTVLAECVELAREFNDETALGRALEFIGAIKWIGDDDLPTARTTLERALAHYGHAGAEDSLMAMTLCMLGSMVAQFGDLERGIALCQECIDLCQSRGEQWARAWGLWNLAFCHWRQRDLPQVVTHAKQALRLKHALHDQLGTPWCVETLSWVAVTEGDAERAAVMFGITDAFWQQIGGSLTGWEAMREWSNQCQAQVRDTLGDPAYNAAFQHGQHLSLEEAVAYALGENPASQPTTAPSAAPQLTRREREVAQLIAQGLTNKDIATTLVISPRTAEAHVEHILTKLGFTSRTQIATWTTHQHNTD
ncbi:LuxR C-terminal-related transcriptional regulator [Saccharopolyspora sp. ASAGF58]|uniref:ATP-binding protein n=1 Tax=Saccharopolyspora sp. ASAGF58 TaxID=2719023 RepID=UPI0014401757|nr:LuxR C-terminal-related transcriptional regulator [Saccharopolyspora sp. ASAGF58]QIZ37812.1 LuxR family transcriptional regulator [Saccharopolyspora sp. ASAGF58]